VVESIPGRLLREVGTRGIGLLILLLAVPFAVTLLLRMTPQLDLIYESPGFHVVAVSAIATSALVVAILTGAVAARGRQPEPVLLALGCLFIGVLLLGHGLTTPGVFGRPFSLWVARFPVLAIAGFAACLLAATSERHSALKRFVARFPRATLLGVSGVVAAGTAAIVAQPFLASGAAPLPGEAAVSHVLMAGAALTLLATGATHWRRWRLGRDRVDLALVMASWLSVDAIVSFELGTLWRVSWWDYHAYLLAGFAAAAWAVVAQYRRTRSMMEAVSTISVSDPLERIARGSPEALTALIGAVEAKDPYTHGHSSMVADISARIGQRIGLDPDSLRGLTHGALLHDVGKIGVPDHVLNKPASLTPEEWGWIKAHPVVGWEMASRAPSLRKALAVVRHHHERWDGSGYPDGLGGDEIPQDARIAAVADVWDALTSDRAYRQAWPLDEALEHIVAARGTLFDPLCVDALLDLMAERGLGVERSGMDPERLAALAEACHPREHVRAGRRRRAG
jgi:HD-GYP domain-containing protein (c-di-GMP phosphodiesterase class II)